MDERPTPETDAIACDGFDGSHLLVPCDFARNLERERDAYAMLLCEAMQVVYATKCHGDSTDLIDRFEALELTPSGEHPANIATTH